MTVDLKLAFRASQSPVAEAAKQELSRFYGNAPLDQADVVIALGGDGFMLQTLHDIQDRSLPVYGMNRGTVGFLMNEYSVINLMKRVTEAEEAAVNPLEMTAVDADGKSHRMLAINEVSILRAGPQAAKLRILIDGRERMDELVCDGALVCTPAGSTAYNYSAHGPILPIGADILALTAMAAFRPRRWRGALLPKSAHVRFEALESVKRPVMADADSRQVKYVQTVDIRSEPNICHRLLFDPGHGLEERLLREQFV